MVWFDSQGGRVRVRFLRLRVRGLLSRDEKVDVVVKGSGLGMGWRMRFSEGHARGE